MDGGDVVVRVSNFPLSGNRYLQTLWLTIFLAVGIWLHYQAPGWDVDVYRNAQHSMRIGHDPYLDAIGVQKAFYSHGPVAPNVDPPFAYVYPPITLPILRFFGRLPGFEEGCIYWTAYGLAMLATLWASLMFAKGDEKRIFIYLAPLAMFFPGLLEDGTILSGNVAHILYAAVLVTAVIGWRRNTWRWFYLAVLVASCVKMPLLSLIAIPVLSAKKQWLKAGATVLVSLALFVLQTHLWPTLFHNYLEALNLMFGFNHDFGCGPAGIFTQWLVEHHLPYAYGTVFYLAYALPLAIVLLHLSRRYFAGDFTLKEWLPVLLVGVILLNPRLIEYDVAPITISLALIAWREASSRTTKKEAGFALGLIFIAANAFALAGWNLRKTIDGPLIVMIFLAGSWRLLQSEPLPALAEVPDVFALPQPQFVEDEIASA
jgi:hypothetical protein